MLLPKIYFNQDTIPLSFRQGVIFTGQEILALQEIAHILDYPTVWVDVENWQDLSQSIQYKLLTGENMSELSDAILQGLTYLGDNATITQTNEQVVNSCCGQTANTGGDVVNDGGITYTGPNTPPASYTGTPAEYEQSRCYGANLMVDVLVAVSRSMADIISLPSFTVTQFGTMVAARLSGATFIEGVGVVIADGAAVLTVGQIVAILAALSVIGFAIDAGLEHVADTAENNHDDYVCQLYNAENDNALTGWLLDLLSDAWGLINGYVSQELLFQSLYGYFLGADYLNRYLDGTYNPVGVVDCNSCVPLTCGVGDTLFLFEDGAIVTGSLSGTAYVSNGKIFNAGPDYYFNLQQCADQSGQWVTIHYDGLWTQSCDYQHKGTCGQGSSAGWATGSTINLTEGFNPNCGTIQSKMSRFTTDGTVNGISYLKITRQS